MAYNMNIYECSNNKMKKLFNIVETILFLGWLFFIGQIAYNYHTCDVMPNNIQLFMMMAYSTLLILINKK